MDRRDKFNVSSDDLPSKYEEAKAFIEAQLPPRHPEVDDIGAILDDMDDGGGASPSSIPRLWSPPAPAPGLAEGGEAQLEDLVATIETVDESVDHLITTADANAEALTDIKNELAGSFMSVGDMLMKLQTEIAGLRSQLADNTDKLAAVLARLDSRLDSR